MKYLSFGEKCVKVHVMKPSGEMFSASVGFVKIGKDAAVAKAIKIRDGAGMRLWGEYWRVLLANENYLISLPSEDEPYLYSKPSPSGGELLYYQLNWSDLNRKRHCMKRSVEKHGFDGAYEQCRTRLKTEYAAYAGIILYMKRHGHRIYRDWTLFD